MDNNYFQSFVDEERRKRQMEAMASRVKQPSGGGKKMSGREIALALIPFGTILDKAAQGQKVGMGEVGLEALLTLGPGRLLKAGKMAQAMKVGNKAAPSATSQVKRLASANITPRGLKFADDVDQVAPEGVQLATKPAETVAKTSMRGRAVAKGNQALASQYGTIPRPVARATDPSETFGKIADLGFTKPQDVERIGSMVTGSDGIINKAVLRATGGATRVKTDGLTRIAEDALENNGVVDSGANSVRAIINAQMKRLAGGPAGSIKPGAHPSEVMAVMKDIEKHIAQRTGRGETYSLPTPASVSEAKALKQFRDELEERLYTGAGANANITKVLTPEFRQELISLAPGNPKWVKHVDENIMTAKDVSTLRSSQAPFVRANRLIESADLNASTYGGRVGNSFGGRTILASAADATINSNPAKRATAKALRFAGGAEANPTAKRGNFATRTANQLLGEVPGQTVRNIGRMEARRGIGWAGYDAFTNPGQASEEPLDLTQLEDGSFGLPDDPSQANLGGEELVGGVTREEIVQAMMDDLTTTGGKNIPELKTLLEAASGGAGANARVTANQQKTLMGIGAASSMVDDIERQLSELPTGRIPGNVAKAQGRFGLNDAVNAYETGRGGLALLLIKQIQGSAGQISDADRQAIYSWIPSVTDTEGERDRKLKRLRNYITSVQSSVYSAPSAQPESLPSSVGDVQFGF
jgi:hypothetical protein